MAQSDDESSIPVESGPEREARIQSLYKQLDVKNTGKLDRRALKEGFARINHPLQNADSFIDNVMRAADVNHDGVIEVPSPSLQQSGLNFIVPRIQDIYHRDRKGIAPSIRSYRHLPQR